MAVLHGEKTKTRWWRSVTIKVMAGTVLLLALSLWLVFSWALDRYVELEHKHATQDVEKVADVVLKSFEIIRPGEESVHGPHLARTVGELPLVENVLIVAVDGTISFSNRPEDIGTPLDLPHREKCSECHGGEHGEVTKPEFTLDDGTVLYHRAFDIPNDPACYSCHQQKYKTLGRLIVTFDKSNTYKENEHFRNSFIYTIIVSLLVVMLGIVVLVHLVIGRPLGRIRGQMRAVEQGNFTLGPAVKSGDELQDLYDSFSHMTRELEYHQQRLKSRLHERSQTVSELTKELRNIYSNLFRLEHLSALGTLSSQVVHEVRTPLNALGLNLQLLQRKLRRQENAPKQLIDLADNVHAEVDRIALVLDRFMKRVKLPMEQPSRQSIQELIRGILVLFGQEAEEAKVGLSMEVDDSLPHIHVLADLVRQVLVNLVSNAIHACKPGGNVLVGAELDESGALIIRVTDDGHGIPPDRLEQIFDPFYTTKPNGTGLGLAIVKQMVSKVRGQISVTSEEYAGTTFTVRLQPQSARQDEAGEQDEE